MLLHFGSFIVCCEYLAINIRHKSDAISSVHLSVALCLVVVDLIYISICSCGDAD